MFKSILRDKFLMFLLVFAVLIKLFSTNSYWVEYYYTYGFYPPFSKLLRFLFGWVPFSLGDLFYAATFFYLIAKAWKFIKVLKARQMATYLSRVLAKKLIKLVLLVYVIFNVFWGLNYNRQGIAKQLRLTVQPYNKAELATALTAIVNRINENAPYIDSLNRLKLNKNKVLFHTAIQSYDKASDVYPFLAYEVPSLKPSIYSHIGHFFGFTGYYNPFSGEAQLKTTVPFAIKPFVVMHEIGHQLGYGKENEANFVSFLACSRSANAEFRYSAYFEMYRYAYRELYQRDSTMALDFKSRLHPQAEKDIQKLVKYFLRTSNWVAPVITLFYDEYLKMNSQPKGTNTYNEVVAWLIAYQKKYGHSAI